MRWRRREAGSYSGICPDGHGRYLRITLTKVREGWTATVARDGQSITTRSFPTKAEAQQWAEAMEGPYPRRETR